MTPSVKWKNMEIALFIVFTLAVFVGWSYIDHNLMIKMVEENKKKYVENEKIFDPDYNPLEEMRKGPGLATVEDAFIWFKNLLADTEAWERDANDRNMFFCEKFPIRIHLKHCQNFADRYMVNYSLFIFVENGENDEKLSIFNSKQSELLRDAAKAMAVEKSKIEREKEVSRQLQILSEKMQFNA